MTLKVSTSTESVETVARLP